MIAGIYCMNGAQAMNLRYVRIWKEDADTKKMMVFLKNYLWDQVYVNSHTNLTISAPEGLVKTIDYYRVTGNVMGLLPPQEILPQQEIITDFYYIPINEFNEEKHDSLRVFKLSGNILAKKIITQQNY